MAQRPWNSILEHIRSLAARPDSPACDAELLLQFVSHHDEAAFESLLGRHGPMVLRVARRIVGNETDAEDVFQATFLLLARRAGAIRKRESVASWLHGVAHRLALSACGKRARRQAKERRAAEARALESNAESAWSELEETLHEVLAHLPAKYRTPLVYCYLEGRTQEEIAQQLGKPLGTVRSWLAGAANCCENACCVAAFRCPRRERAPPCWPRPAPRRRRCRFRCDSPR
ncbi:MAG: RNA polymerase sigma factor [Gemmataceae bacterium]